MICLKDFKEQLTRDFPDCLHIKVGKKIVEGWDGLNGVSAASWIDGKFLLTYLRCLSF